MFNSPVIGLAVCLALAVCTALARESLWHLGGTYWLVLVLLALVQIALSSVVFVASRGRLRIRLAVVGLLIVAQWWLIQMLAMQVVWRLRDFAP